VCPEVEEAVKRTINLDGMVLLPYFIGQRKIFEGSSGAKFA
jgi:hypothetical protein